MSALHTNTYPKLHNAMWPGLVGKGSPGAEPSIDLDTMLSLTARAEVDGIRFDGVDIFLFDPHVSIDISDDGIKRLADKVTSHGFVVGSVVAPVWQPTGGGPALGTEEDRRNFVGQVRKACRIAKKLRDLGARPHGIVRIDSACSVQDWSQDPEGNQQRIAQTFAEACDVAEGYGERLAAEGEICWGGMHSWKKMVDLLERVNRPRSLGFQADMAHTLLYVLGYNEPGDALLPPDWGWTDPAELDHALKSLTDALRPWTIDFHVAQNDATVKGSGTHDKTGHHCLPNDPKGKLSIPHHARFWMRDEHGAPNKAFSHVCWDGCMFPNAVMAEPETWNNILSTMIAVRDAHGWTDAPKPDERVLDAVVEVEIEAPAKVAIKRAKPKRAAKSRKSKPVRKAVKKRKSTRSKSVRARASGRKAKKKSPAPKSSRKSVRSSSGKGKARKSAGKRRAKR